MNKKYLIPGILFILGCSTVSGEQNIQQNIFLNDDKVELTLTPDTPLARQAVTTWNSNEKPRLTNEKLFALKKSELPEGVDIGRISKIVRSISTMKGQTYYSNRHKKTEILYHDAYLIDGPKSKKRIADDTEGSAEGKVLYCMQDDNSFGKCYYKLNYHQTQNEVSVCFDNFESLKFGFITAAKAHNIKINFVAVDNGDEFLIYLIVQAYYPRISVLEDKMIDSFNARVDSIYKWFVGQLAD